MSIAKGDLSRVGCAADTLTFPVIFEDSWGTERDCKRSNGPPLRSAPTRFTPQS
jgi:hypothetical protein